MDDRIQAVLNYLEQHLYTSVSLTNLSEVAHVSPYHLHRIFKSETGATLKKFTDMLKMEKAFQYIVDGDDNVKEAAVKLGYSDYETFSRAFKRYHKVAPDILKAVSLKLHQQIQGLENSGNIIVVANATSDKKEIEEKIRKKLEESGIQITDNTQIQTYVLHRTDESTNPVTEMIRNKYSFQKGDKTWQMVLQKLKTEKGN